MLKLQFNERDLKLLKSLSEEQLAGTYNHISFLVLEAKKDKRLAMDYNKTIADAIALEQTVAKEICERNNIAPVSTSPSNLNPSGISYLSTDFQIWLRKYKNAGADVQTIEQFSFIKALSQLALM